MFASFKKEETAQPDVKAVREKIVKFIKEQLQLWEGGEGGDIRNIQLFIYCAPNEQAIYSAALYAEEENRFKKEEVQRVADDYALQLPSEWELVLLFETPPSNAASAKDLPVALLIGNKKKNVAAQKMRCAFIKILNGEAEQEHYAFTDESGKVTMGRDKMVQAGDGFFRENTIAFLASSSHESNKFISRQHAHIEWDADGGIFKLFADEGGIPPRNKVKVRPKNGDVIKLQNTHIGYTLQDGDQIILGDSALLQFGYQD